MLVHAFNTNRLDKLKEATKDKLHQPQRSGIMPILFPVIDAVSRCIYFFLEKIFFC